MNQSCIFCSSKEGYICSNCIQKLLLIDREKLKKAYDLAVQKGFIDRAQVIQKLLESEEVEYVPKTSKGRRNLVRERFVRTIRPSNR
jgi:hypothetical protein